METGERLKRHAGNGQAPLIIHLGDHDPSGIDMTRDITDRLDMFTGGVPVERIALNYDQVLQYNPPPNPAKMTDSRFEAYQAEHGNESWELDALAPNVIGTMITEAILARRDEAKWAAQEAEEEEGRAKLLRISDHYRALADLLDPDLPDGAVAHGIDMGAEAAREWEGSE